MNALAALDRQIFLLINGLPHPSWGDTLALVLSAVGTSGIIWFVLAGILFIREERRNHWFFVPLLLAAAGSWLTVEKILKPFVARLRPSLEIGAIMVGEAKDTYSFPSGHATIAFAMAVILSHREPRWRRHFFILAILIALSRIYLGVHYPLDVIAGSLLGFAIGNLSLRVSK